MSQRFLESVLGSPGAFQQFIVQPKGFMYRPAMHSWAFKALTYHTLAAYVCTICVYVGIYVGILYVKLQQLDWPQQGKQ